ncbi:MAG: hypothetical protein H7099_15855 [Gemmatimonadaceae bacterium]|nr:hypothetical protein [Gemmatimonadaceae bacterium]
MISVISGQAPNRAVRSSKGGWFDRHLATLLALIVASAVVTVRSHAQSVDKVTYDWAGQTLTIPKVVTSRHRMELTIINLNSLCYTYTVDAKAISSNTDADVAKAIIVALGAGGESVPRASKEATLDTVRKSTGMLSVSPHAASEPTPAETELTNLRQSAATALDRLKTAEERMIAAREAGEALYRVSCTPGVRGTATDAVRKPAVKALETALKQYDDTRASIPALISAARSQLQKLRVVFQNSDSPELSSRSTPERRKAHVAEMRAALDSIDQLLAGTTARTTVLDAARTELRKAELFAAEDPANSKVVRNEYITDHTDSIVVTIVATGRASVPGMKDVKLEDKFTIHVYRRFRFFLSTGVLASFLPNNQYERANIPARVGPDSARRDTTYSRFVDRDGGNIATFAPVAMASMTFARGWMDYSVSFGAGARTVNAKTAPEYVLGLSASLLDRLVITAGVHLGRVQRLLISQDSTASIPIAVTADDAVGLRWRRNFGLVVSVRP